MKYILHVIAVFLLTAAAGAREFTWTPFDGPAITTVQVENPDFKRGAAEHLKHWSIPRRPASGLIGYLDIKQMPASGAVYTVRLRAYQVLVKDLDTPVEKPEPFRWFEPMGLLRPGAPRRVMRYEHLRTIDSSPARIPVVLPHTEQELNHCELTVLDESGAVLFTATPAEIFGAESHYGQQYAAWIFSDDESADRRLREQARIYSASTVKALPSDWRHFTETHALWIDDHTTISDQLLRRLLLTGTYIFGRPEGLQPFSARLGLPQHANILTGVIMPLTDDSAQNHRVAQRSRDERFNFTSRGFHHKTGIPAPLQNNTSLFRRIKTKYLLFTFICAGFYALGAAIMLPILFLRLRGEQRVQLWWRAPLAIALYSLLVLIGGWGLVLPKAPLADVTEYRLGYGDWPEVFCVVNARAFRFGPKPFGWHFPAGAILPFRENLPHSTRVTDGERRPGTVRYDRTPRGMDISSGFGQFIEMPQPFQAVLDDGRLTITSRRAVKDVYIALNKQMWLPLGEFEPGMARMVPKDQDGLDVTGMPGAIQNVLKTADCSGVVVKEGKLDDEVCSNCNVRHKRSEVTVATIDDGVVLIALDAEAAPSVRGLNAREDRQGRVAWICQVPIHRPTPPNAAPPGETMP